MITFNPEVTLGNFITMLTLIGGFVAFFVKYGMRTQSRIERVEGSFVHLQEAQQKHQLALDEMMKLGVLTNQSNHERRILQLEAIMLVIPEIRTNLEWIKKKIENMDAQREHMHG